MNEKIKKIFYEHIGKAQELIELGRLDEAFSTLEIAHVLGQRSIIPHTVSHLYMLRIGLLKRDVREILGQLFRIPTGMIGSAVGILPIGNTGGSNVSPFKKMKTSDEIKELMK